MHPFLPQEEYIMDTRVVEEQWKLLIDGKRVDAADGAVLAVRDPATEDVIAHVAQGGATDIDRAVAAARRALGRDSWGGFRAADRGKVLYRMAALMREAQDEFVRLESLSAGKPVSAVRRQDLPAAIDTLEYYAGWADKIHGDVIPARADALTYTLREPVGVVGIIIPWNFPLMIGLWKIAPALACGCTVVVKPAELTPLTAHLLGQIALEAGLPPGALNIVPGKGTVAGMALVEHADVDKISFTGSPAVGKTIMRGAAQNLKRVSLELGGKSANIVFADANLDAAAKATAAGIFFNAGQVCSAGSRVLVQDSVYDEFVDLVVARAKKLRIGDTQDPATSLGPVISRSQMDKILEYVDVGQQEGAALVTGGRRAADTGYFIEPTVFADVHNSMRIAQEEIFGPVLGVIKFKTDEEAVQIANGTNYSLAAGLWSRDVTRVHTLTPQIRAGTVWVNTYGPTDIRLPWGGARDSGLGRERGKEALEAYTEPKAIWVALNQ
jgi:aldehyde dehydrogenase (NAD+)